MNGRIRRTFEIVEAKLKQDSNSSNSEEEVLFPKQPRPQLDVESALIASTSTSAQSSQVWLKASPDKDQEAVTKQNQMIAASQFQYLEEKGHRNMSGTERKERGDHSDYNANFDPNKEEKKSQVMKKVDSDSARSSSVTDQIQTLDVGGEQEEDSCSLPSWIIGPGKEELPDFQAAMARAKVLNWMERNEKAAAVSSELSEDEAEASEQGFNNTDLGKPAEEKPVKTKEMMTALTRTEVPASENKNTSFKQDMDKLEEEKRSLKTKERVANLMKKKKMPESETVKKSYPESEIEKESAPETESLRAGDKLSLFQGKHVQLYEVDNFKFLNPNFLALHISALLNSGGGDIFAGVSTDRVIQGVRISRDERDKARQMMDYISRDLIDPSVTANDVDIDFIKLAEAGEDQRVLRISVRRILTSNLFRARGISRAGFKNGIYIRDIVEPFVKHID